MRRIAFLFAGVLVTSTAAAQPADVPALVKLVESKPADLDKSAWKEKRRDAARKLGQSKDKRAVPALIRIAETETFDIIGEIAIEGLGNLNDQSAVPVLQKIANDPNREKPQRDLARKALGKLGASPDVKPGGTPPPPDDTTPPPPPGGTPTPPPPGGTPGGTTTGEVTTGGTELTSGGGTAAPGSDLLGGGKATADLPELPQLSDDTLGAFERVTFALGTAQLQYDTVRERSSFDFDVAGFYAKRVERESMAWGWDAGAHVVAGFINPTGREQVRGAQVNLTGNGEARFYKGNVYGVGKAAAGAQVSYFAFRDVDPNNDEKDARTTVDLQIALGGGYGRVLDVGGAIRVRRLSRTLDAARALGKPIDSATARQLELTWWALRSERSSYRALVATVAILRQAGILLVEPDAGLTYEILNVLRDPQLFLRPSGFDIQLAFSEGYLIRPDEEGVVAPSGEEDRVEQALFLASYGKQLAEDKLEVSGAAYGRLRLFAPEEQPEPWAVGASARMRRFTYGEHGDPFGAFDLAGEVRLSDADDLNNDDDDIGLRVSGQLGFTWWINQASGLRLAANVAVDGGELFVGAQLSATYGFLDATFAGL